MKKLVLCRVVDRRDRSLELVVEIILLTGAKIEEATGGGSVWLATPNQSVAGSSDAGAIKHEVEPRCSKALWSREFHWMT